MVRKQGAATTEKKWMRGKDERMTEAEKADSDDGDQRSATSLHCHSAEDTSGA
jgi:hypothetical protein